MDFDRLKDSIEQSIHIFSLDGNIAYKGSDWDVLLGGKASSSDDEFYLHPILESRYLLPSDIGILRLNISGGLARQGYLQLIKVNPFLESRLDSFAVSNQYLYSLILEGNYRDVGYQLSVNYHDDDSRAMFYTQSSEVSFSEFNLIFDDIKDLNFKLNLDYIYQEQIQFQLAMVKTLLFRQ